MYFIKIVVYKMNNIVPCTIKINRYLGQFLSRLAFSYDDCSLYVVSDMKNHNIDGSLRLFNYNTNIFAELDLKLSYFATQLVVYNDLLLFPFVDGETYDECSLLGCLTVMNLKSKSISKIKTHPLMMPRYNNFSVICNDKLFVGFGNIFSKLMICNDIWSFDFKNQCWKKELCDYYYNLNLNCIFSSVSIDHKLYIAQRYESFIRKIYVFNTISKIMEDVLDIDTLFPIDTFCNSDFLCYGSKLYIRCDSITNCLKFNVYDVYSKKTGVLRLPSKCGRCGVSVVVNDCIYLHNYAKTFIFSLNDNIRFKLNLLAQQKYAFSDVCIKCFI